MLKIATLSPHLHYGGDANRILHFARSLDRTRFDHRALILIPETPIRSEQAGTMLPEYRRHGIPVDELSDEVFHERRDGQRKLTRIMSDAAALARMLGRLTMYLRRHDIDVVDARGAHASLLGCLAARMARVPIVIATSYDPHLWTETLGRPIGAAVLGQLGAFITDSEERRDGFAALARSPKPQFLVIPNGIHPPDSERTRGEMLARLGLPTDPRTKIVAQVSRLLRFKGQEDLLRAAPKVLERHPHAAFLIVGHANRDPSYLDGLHRLSRDLGIEARVSIRGYSGPIGDVWRAVDVHAHPSHYDSSPIAIHESMASGLPVVATRVGGIPELVLDDTTGYLIEPGNIEQLVAGITRLLDDEQGAAAMGAAGRAHYEANHSARVMTAAIEDLLLDLWREQRGGRRAA